jgi:hypothetical protein
MAATEYARGRNITASPVPIELTYFSLAQEYKWLPDQIDRQDPKKLKGLLHILSIYNNIKNEEIKRENRKNARR